jgi:hypothetical protein
MDKDKLVWIAVGVALGVYVVPKLRAKIGH